MWFWLIALLIAVLLWWKPSIVRRITNAGHEWWDIYLRRLMFQSACGEAREDPDGGLRLCQLDENDVAQTIQCLHKMVGEVPDMKTLQLSLSDLSSEAFMKIWAEGQHLLKWSFQGCRLGYDQWSDDKNMALQPLRRRKVRVLHAIDCHITAAQLHHVAQDFGRPQMTAVEMMKKVNQAMAPDLSLAWNLMALNLSMNPLAGAGRSLGTLMRSLPTLTALVLMQCELTLEDPNSWRQPMGGPICWDPSWQDIEQIAKALPRSSLYYLELAQNSLGSKGLLAITRTLASSKLQSLGLERNEIEAGDALNELKLAHEKRPFSNLKLNDNLLSPSDLKAFEDSLKKVTSDFCPPGCRCFEGRGEVM
eukprot:s451_g3.t1